MDDTVLTTVADLVEATTGRDAREVVPDALLERDLGLDSLALLEVVVRAEDRLGVVLPEEVPHLVTVGDVVTHIAEALAGTGPLLRAG